MNETFIKRFERDIIKTKGCWYWKSPSVYGYYSYGMILDENKKLRLAHRVSYELYVGKIPNGLVIDHMCMQRRCVNPKHLQAITREENIRLGHRTTKAFCKKGHLRTSESINNRGACRECMKECSRRNYEKYRKNPNK